MRNPLKQSMLISAVAIRGLWRTLGIKSYRIENLPFTLMMENNIRDTHHLYSDSKSTKLLSAILLRFKEEAQRRGHIPLVVVMPQLLDLKLNKNNPAPYQDYFSDLKRHLHVLDLTEKFIDTDFEELYINDQYGGHLSVEGNFLVAKEISTWLKVTT